MVRSLSNLSIAGLACALAACGGRDDAAPGALAFTNVTRASGIDFSLTSGKIPTTQVLEAKGGGIALIDYDADGDDDVFVPNGATLDSPAKGPGCRLFRNDGGLNFTDVTAAAGLTFDRWGQGAAVGDVDGNGFDDVFIAAYGKNALLLNRDGHFEEATDAAGLADDRWSTAACFGDLDGDGDLDLYVVNYLKFDPANPPENVYFLGAHVFAGPLGLSGQLDVVYENLGGARFQDVTKAWGFVESPPSYGLGVVILDFDGDGRQDVFVGNDSQPNFLFKNLGDRRFEEIGAAAGIAVGEEGVGQATMGIAIGDVRGDGLPSVFTTNFMNDVDTLHVNLGGMEFEDQTQRYGLGLVSRPFLKWGTSFQDFDLDGDEDLVVFNGHVYSKEVTEPKGWMRDEVPLLFERNGNRFERVFSDRGGAWLDELHCDRSAAFSDLDDDGDVDIVVNELCGPLRVLRCDARGTWCEVDLVDAAHAQNRRGIGSKIVLVGADGSRRTRFVQPVGSYQSSNSPRAHFGVPAAAAGALALEITWSDGATQKVADVRPNTRVRVERPR